MVIKNIFGVIQKEANIFSIPSNKLSSGKFQHSTQLRPLLREDDQYGVCLHLPELVSVLPSVYRTKLLLQPADIVNTNRHLRYFVMLRHSASASCSLVTQNTSSVFSITTITQTCFIYHKVVTKQQN